MRSSHNQTQKETELSAIKDIVRAKYDELSSVLTKSMVASKSAYMCQPSYAASEIQLTQEELLKKELFLRLLEMPASQIEKLLEFFGIQQETATTVAEDPVKGEQQ